MFIRKPTLSPDVAKLPVNPPSGQLGMRTELLGSGCRPTCPARRGWAEAERGGRGRAAAAPRSQPASFPPSLPSCRSPAPSQALRDSGNPPVRLTWSPGRANLFISSAGSPGGKFNNRRRQSNTSYNSALLFLSPCRSPPPNQIFTTVVFYSPLATSS